MSGKQNKLALMVGVNNSEGSSSREMLKFAEQDASAMAWALQEERCSFRLIEPVLRGPEAKTREVQQAIIKLAEGRTEQDFLLFYFSGHAQPMETSGGHKDIYLVTYDFKESDLKFGPTMHLSMRWLRETLYEHTDAGAVLLILDCCYAGNIAQAGSDPYLIDFGKLIENWLDESGASTRKNYPRATLTATGYNIAARETGGHGRMTKYILEALHDENAEVEVDSEGRVDVPSLHKYLRKKIPEQLPDLVAATLGQHAWVLAHHPKRSARRRKEAEESAILEKIEKVLNTKTDTEPHIQPFDLNVSRKASFEDLDQERVAEFFKQDRAQKKAAFYDIASDRDKLLKFGFLQKSYPTYGTLLCFGQNLPQWVSGAVTRCIRWNGNNNLYGFRDSQFYEDGLLRQFESGCQFLQKHLDLGREITSQGSTEKWEIPLVVLREALANALIHREYNNRTDFVQVEVFDDRVEIKSPGGLPSSMDPAVFEEQFVSRPRNAQIANIFYLYGHVEEAGSGIPRMQHFMKEAGLEKPEFKIGPDLFRVIIYRPKLALREESPSKAPPTIWNVPYPRNVWFTGREELLTRLAAALQTEQTMTLSQPQAISGLGGIGKTQTALEYAYRYHQHYQAVLWARADTYDALISDFVALAELLQLPQREEKDQLKAVQAVKDWLKTHDRWLLILDNADDLALLKDFLPPAGAGHTLLTTRATSMGRLAGRIEVETLAQEVGALFLLRRAGLLAPDADLQQAGVGDRAAALEITRELGGLPLALDQAGAYIEKIQCSLPDYLQLYRAHRTDLLKERGGLVPDHPEPVATTWSLSFTKIEQSNPAAADLLRLCAFLHPDAIPEEIIAKGASELGPVLQLVADDPIKLYIAIGELLKYSLIHRNPVAQTLTLHRLVQAILIDEMNENMQRLWAERTVRAVNRAFPEVEFATWGSCQRCLPHVEACAVLIEQWGMEFIEATALLNSAGEYLHTRAQYTEAEPLYQRALAIREKTLGPEHPLIAQSLNNLARLYDALGRYTLAEPLYQRALFIREKLLGQKHPDVAQSLNNLGRLYDTQGKYEQAEPLYQRALAIDEQLLGPEHPEVATDLNNLALLYYNQGIYEQAEPLYQRALAIGEQMLGPEHPEVATDLNNLALLYQAQGKYERAEPLLRRALAICEKVLGAEHPDTATSLNNLALLYYNQGRYEQAEPLYLRALRIWEQNLGPEHPHVAILLKNYADLLGKTDREAEAKILEERAGKIEAKS